MGFFGKKKAVEQPVPEQPTPAQLIQQEQVKMAGARSALDVLVEELNALQMPAFENNMMKAAQQNEETADRNGEILKAVRENNPSEAYMTENRLELEQDLYIFPTELQDYRTMIKAVAGAYTHNMSAAEACAVGADEIDPLILPFVRKFSEALTDGQKLKADVCCEVLKYAVLVVHKRPIESKNEETVRKVIELRKNTIEDVFWAAIRTVDKIYGDIAALSNAERSYEARRQKYMEEDKKLDSIPEKYQEEFEVLGFAGAEKLPINHPLRSFLSLEINARNALSYVEMAKLDIERYTAEITRLRGELQAFRDEAQKRFVTEQSMDYNEEETQNALKRITERTVSDINDMFRAEAESYEMGKRIESLIHAAASNQAWVENAVESRDYRMHYKKSMEAYNDFNKMYTENKNKPPQIENEPQVNEQPEEENKIMADMG